MYKTTALRFSVLVIFEIGFSVFTLKLTPVFRF